MMTEKQELLSAFPSITLEEMSGIRLMNRLDTKYVLPLGTLGLFLRLAVEDYRIQEVEGERDITYHTLYLDTSERSMYLAHQCGRAVREKIRVRTYVPSGLTFLEVKNKNNKGRTDKKRIPVTSAATLEDEGGERLSGSVCLVRPEATLVPIGKPFLAYHTREPCLHGASHHRQRHPFPQPAERPPRLPERTCRGGAEARRTYPVTCP